MRIEVSPTGPALRRNVQTQAAGVHPNLGPFAHADGVIKRATQGMDPGAWAPESAMILFEEMQRAGH
ncbi:MAG: hypothetical protein ACKV22_40925, partial [Bryobacteraceae bacterium]